MAPRANWKGYLKLSLVSCAVELFPASSTKERISFNLLNRETGHRLKRQLVDSETGDVVEPEDQVRGFEVAKRDYLIVEDDVLDTIAVESTHTIDIESFVPRTEIDEVYLDTPYYLVPDGKVAEEAFAVIREAMRVKRVVGLGRVVLHRRERIVMLEPRGKGIAARTLRYAYEVRDDEDYFDDIGDVSISGEMLDLAEHIIDKKLTNFDPTRFEDRYQNALIDLIKAKSGDRPVPKIAAAAKPSNVINLMDALRKSIAAEKKEGPTTKPSARPARAAAKSAGTSVTKKSRAASKTASKSAGRKLRRAG
jgi:DNA end-binding protein Ku